MKHKVLLALFLISACFYGNEIKADSITKEFIALFLPKNPVIVEAGAYNGNDTVAMSHLWPQGIIYAFEPIPRLFQLLNANTQPCKNVICVEKALSDKLGHSTMFISAGIFGGDASSSLLAPDTQLSYYFPQISFEEKVVVETTILDTWAKDINIDHIDFLWLDLQGMELFVLKASPEILKTVKVIQLEVSYTNLYKDAPLDEEIRAWMEENGFVAIKEFKAHPSWGDILFVRKNY